MNRVEKEDLLKINLLNDVILSNNGETAVYIQQRVYEKTPYCRSHLMIQEIESGKTKKIISGNWVAHPLFSEDDKQLFFLGEETGRMQLYRYDMEQEKCEKLTSMYRGVSAYVLGKDENCCFFLSKVKPDDSEQNLFCEMTEEQSKKENDLRENSAHHLTSMQYRMDGQGYKSEEYGQVFVLNQNGAVKKLQQPTVSFTELALSPGGRYLSLVSEPAEFPDMKPEHNILWGYDTQKDHFSQWVGDEYLMQWPKWAGDEENVYFCGHDYRFGWNTLVRLYRYCLKDDSCCCMTEELDVEFVDSGITDIRGGNGNRGMVFSPEDNCFYFLYSKDGNTCVASYTLENGTVTDLTHGKEHIYSFDQKNDRVIYIYTAPLIPNDIKLYSLKTKEYKHLTNSNQEYLETIELSVPQEISAKSKDGLEIHGWIMKPVDYKPGEKYPAVLEIHGGPSLMYANAFMHEFQYLAANGYVIFYCNPRGGSGRGQVFEAGIVGAQGGRGTNDFWDLMAITDLVEKFDFVDEKHIGVTGGSYGGLMTNWVVTHTTRYQAALTQRSIVNLVSFRGTSDLGFVDPANSYQVDFFDDDYLHSMSPLTYVKNVETPLCILHSENDYRCPVTQGQELFAALKKLGKTVEMYVFPNSSHGLSRNGKYPLRIQRLEIIRQWFDRFLKTDLN